MHLELPLTIKQAAQTRAYPDHELIGEYIDAMEAGPEHAATPPITEPRSDPAWAYTLHGKSSSNPEINALTEALCEKLPEDLTHADRIDAIETIVLEQIHEEVEFLYSKWFEARATAQDSPSRLQELRCKYAIEVYDAHARRCLALVPVVISHDRYLKILDAWCGHTERVFLGGTGWFYCPVAWYLYGTRNCQQFKLLMAARASYWRGEAWKQIHDLEREGVLYISDGRDSDFYRKLIRGMWRIESKREDIPPAESQPEPAADSSPAEPWASSILPRSGDAMPGGAAPAKKPPCPKLAPWLEARMNEHELLPHGLYKGTGLKAKGPDPATTKRILAGEKVSEGTLLTLARAFGVPRKEIPND